MGLYKKVFFSYFEKKGFVKLTNYNGYIKMNNEICLNEADHLLNTVFSFFWQFCQNVLFQQYIQQMLKLKIIHHTLF